MVEEKHEKQIENLLIPAGLLIGLGIGFSIDQVAAGTLIGLGAGFLATFIYHMTSITKKK